MAKRKRKRANNEGSIYQRNNGSWRAQVTLDGQRIGFTGSTQRECLDWVQMLNNQISAGMTYEYTRVTLNEFMTEWLTNIEGSLRNTTLTQYKQVTRDYILPALGNEKVKELSTDQIQRLYKKQLDKGLGARSVKTIHAVLHVALNRAVELGVLSKNPASAAKPPKPKQKEMQFYDKRQVKRFLQTAKENEDRYLALFKLAITTGMRQAELLALKWSDVDLEKGNLKVQRQLKRIPGGGFTYTAPKTKAGKRTVLIGEDMINSLVSHQKQLTQDRLVAGEKWKENNLMFPSSVGTHTQPDKLLKRFKRIAKQAGLPIIRFHDLRHTAASLMLNSGVPAIVASRRLGHSKPSITLDIYGHLIPSMQEQVAVLMDEITSLTQ